MQPLLDIPATLTQGGEGYVSLLQFCLRSGHLEPLFLALVKEYQQKPSHLSALTLYDLFCAANAPARLSVAQVLPPQDLKLAGLMPLLRAQWTQMQAREAVDEEKRLFIAQPQRSLFDSILPALPAAFEGVAQQFDPSKRVNDSLPGGTMSAGQRNWINQVWLKQVRPKLTAAGFWRVATLE
jgi:hypothetical protein